ncbi:head-tail adaptor protein [Mesorhizobium sp. A623]
MAALTTASDLREVADFQNYIEVDDGFGGTKLEFATIFTAPCRIRTLKAGETIIASRLAGTATLVLTIRWQPAAAEITPAWKALNARSGATYEIKAATTDERKAWVDLLVEETVT